VTISYRLLQADDRLHQVTTSGIGYDHIAGRLNDDGFKTRQRKPFQAMTVYRTVKRNGGGV
jgi:hypothetical protein